MSPGPYRGRPAGTDGPGTPGRSAGARRWQLVRANRDAVPPSTRRFMRRARQRRMRAVLPWAVTSAVLAVGALVAWVVWGTGLFGVREVQVVGADLVTPVEVRDAAQIADGMPLARVDLAATGARVATLPPVRTAVVTRDWPDRLVIRVVERTGVAVVPKGDRFLVVDAGGVVFRSLAEPPPGLPVVRLAAPGPDDPATRAGLDVLASLTPQLRAQLSEVVVEGLARIKVLLRDDRTIIWGDATRSDFKARVATSVLGRPGGPIDVSAPDVVTIG